MKKLFLTTLVFAMGLGINSFAANEKKETKKETAAAQKVELNTEASKIMWVGKKIAGPHNGTVNLKDGHVTVEGKKVTGGMFTVDMTTIKNLDVTDAGYNKKLVDHLASDDFFSVGKYPTAVFTVTSIKPGKANEYTVTGDLKIKDITKSVTFPAKIKEEKGVHTANAKFKINRLDWGVKYNSGKFFDVKALGDKVINDEIEFELDLKTVAAK